MTKPLRLNDLAGILIRMGMREVVELTRDEVMELINSYEDYQNLKESLELRGIELETIGA
jgi:hypothetical protein